MTKKALMSVEEKQRLEELETIIKTDLKGFLRVGMALKEIKETRLYRDKYDTWKDYLKAEWDLGRRFADHQIAAYSVVKNIEEKWNNCSTFEAISNDFQQIIIPQNEAQARPLTLLQPVQQCKAWQKAIIRTGGKPTALAVRKVVEEILYESEKLALEVLKSEPKTDGSEEDDSNTDEVEEVPEEFSEAYNQVLNVLVKYIKVGLKASERKEIKRKINALSSYFE